MNYPTGNAAGDDHPAFHIPTGFEDELDRELAALQREFESGSSATPAFAASNEVSEFGDAAVEAIAFLDAAETQYRDATHAFANGGGALDLALQAEAFTESNFFKGSSAAPQFVMDKSMAFKKTPVASPLSPSSYQFESSALPEKEVGFDSFLHVNPTFSSHSSPDKVMDALQRSLKSFAGCSFSVQQKWTLRVSWVCVAEEITFSIALSRPRGSSTQCDVDFHLIVGDEAKFVELAECVRSQCSEVDDEALFFLSKTLEPWMDATQELKGRRYAIDASEAASLIADMNTELHADTMYEVAKAVKNHCRHKGNRRLFLQTDRSSFLMALRGMLGDSEEVARFAVFILQQFAKDELEDSAAFFASAFDRNSFALLLEGLAKRETSSACAQFTHSMVEQVQHSWIFA